MHYLLSLVLCSTGTLFGMHHINTSLSQFQPDSFVQQVKQEKDKEQKEILQIKTNYNKARKKDQCIQSITGVSGNHHVVQWFEDTILPSITNLPSNDARKQLYKVPSNAWFKHLKSKDITQCPSTLLIALPDELIEKEIVPFLFDGNMQAAEAFNTYAKQSGIGKAIELFSLINQSKGIQPWPIAYSFTLYCKSPEIYMICKRLIPEFNKQYKNKIFELSFSEREIMLEKADIKISRKEQKLLNSTNDAFKQIIAPFYVIPERELLQTLIFQAGEIGSLVCPASIGVGTMGLASVLHNPTNFNSSTFFLSLAYLGLGGLFSYFGRDMYKNYSIINPFSLPKRLNNTGYWSMHPRPISEVLK